MNYELVDRVSDCLTVWLSSFSCCPSSSSSSSLRPLVLVAPKIVPRCPSVRLNLASCLPDRASRWVPSQKIWCGTASCVVVISVCTRTVLYCTDRLYLCRSPLGLYVRGRVSFAGAIRRGGLVPFHFLFLSLVL